jgi:hypothetical protein
MRKTFQLLITIALIFVWSSLQAQGQEHSAGPIPTDVMGTTNFTGLGADATVGYAYAGVTLAGTVTVGIPSGTLTLITPFAFTGFGASACKGGDGNYYIAESGPPNNLHQLDTGTGNVTLIGAITGLQGAETPTGLAYNPVDGMYYMTAGDLGLGTDNLYSFDLGTLTATLIGGSGTGGLQIDLCISGAGVCYSYDLITDNGYTLDLTTGAATLLGPLGFDPNFGQGMAYDRETNTIYLSAFDNGAFTGQFRTMDPVTGNTTLVLDWGFEQVAPFALDTDILPIPVELTSFAASVSDGNVNLNWTTATEQNNQGFEVQRSTDNQFTSIGFVNGSGTTTEVHSYSYVDASVEVGTYTYRLKQVDYDGTFEYSSVVEVDVTAPNVFALEQNYPNPFNPSTMIKFNLAADSKVSLTIFDVLGQEVANLISGNLTAGSHEIDFNASNVNSGVYFYRIDATAVDGTNFTSVKKMILTK